MKNVIPSLLLLSLILVDFTAAAQCRRFTKQRVISTLDSGASLDLIAAGTLGRGESAATLLNIPQPGAVDLIISTHPDLGRVEFSIVGTDGKVHQRGETRDQVKRVSVEAETDLIVHIQSEQASGTYTPLGCVAVAAVRTVPNEMDILTE